WKQRINDAAYMTNEDLMTQVVIYDRSDSGDHRGHSNKKEEADYSYLIDDISDRMKSDEGLAMRKKELRSLRKELAELNKLASQGSFQGAAIWRHELDELETRVRAGIKTDWLYDD